MTEQQLKDTIIAQAVRIAEPEEELASENWMSNYYRKECSELRDKIAKLRNQSDMAWLLFGLDPDSIKEVGK